MKFFHLSDLHIGLKLFNRDLSGDQEYIFREIIQKAAEEKPDAVVIAGDIYDKAVPSADAVELFDRFLSKLSEAVPEAEIMMISGNHDSAVRINCFRSVLKTRRIRMIGIPPQKPDEYIEKVTLTDQFGEVHFYLLPFVKPSMVKAITGTAENGNNLSYNEAVRSLLERESIDESARNVLVSHQFYIPKGSSADDVERMESEIRTVGNIDEVSSDALLPFDYAALGHIHKPMKVGNPNWRYCGTPLACSLSEAGQQKGIVMVEMEEKGTVKTTVLPLVPLRQVREIKGLLKEVLEEGCEDYVSVVLTDKAGLDAVDMADRLKAAFPNLLEIRRSDLLRPDYTRRYDTEKMPDAFTLCTSFLGDTDEEEKALLRKVVNKVMENIE